MIVLGIDPGPLGGPCGWSLLERDGARPPRWIDGGHHTIDVPLAQLYRCSLVGLEWQVAAVLYQRKRHGGLVEMARQEGVLADRIERAGVKLVKLSYGQWTGDIGCGPSPAPDEVAAVLRLRVSGVPVPPVLTSSALVHALDALGVALAAACAPGEQLRLLAGGRRR